MISDGPSAEMEMILWPRKLGTLPTYFRSSCDTGGMRVPIQEIIVIGRGCQARSGFKRIDSISRKKGTGRWRISQKVS